MTATSNIAEILNKNLRVTGNTYPVREQIKSLGCVWGKTEKCWFAPDADTQAKALAIVGKPVYNSPPPQDNGPVDVKAEAAKRGRVALNEVSVSFRRETMKGGDETGELFWGKHKKVRNRYLVVRSSRPRYFSRDMLEDFDMFDIDPGWYCDCDCVAVEPTPDEIKNDPAVAKAKEAALEKRKFEIEHQVQHSPQEKDARLQRFDLNGMTECWGKHRMAGHEALWSDGVSRLVYETSAYDDGPSAWSLTDPTLASEALSLKK